MNHVSSESKQNYDEKSPRTAAVVILYCNLLINITYGVIYMLLNKTLFPDAATNIAISLAFTETVILYFAIITVHNKKTFMFMWVIFIILFNSSLIIIASMVHFFNGYCNTSEQYISRKLYELESQFPNILSTEWEELLLKYVPVVVASFVFATLFFKLYSMWAIDRYQFRSRLVRSITSPLFRSKKLKISKRVAVPVP